MIVSPTFSRASFVSHNSFSMMPFHTVLLTYTAIVPDEASFCLIIVVECRNKSFSFFTIKTVRFTIKKIVQIL